MLSEKEQNFGFWKNLILVVLFFTLTPVALGTSLFSLIALANNQVVEEKEVANLIDSPQSGIQVYAALPDSQPSISGEADVGDARPEILKQYLQDYRSPLAPFTEEIVAAADKYGLDYRLIVAIAQQESNLCKIIPPGSYNCWGWGIHSEGTLGFEDYVQGIWDVSQGLRENYIDLGYDTVEKIMSKYTPLSNGSWAYGVNKFMSEMQ